jgi:hypothetical protein
MMITARMIAIATPKPISHQTAAWNKSRFSARTCLSKK